MMFRKQSFARTYSAVTQFVVQAAGPPLRRCPVPLSTPQTRSPHRPRPCRDGEPAMHRDP